jgi:large subunit ribosomal protein L3
MAETQETRSSATGKKIRKSLLGKKVGMTQVFDENGVWVPVTVLEVGPCTVLQVKTAEKDGYTAVQVGFGPRRKKPARPQGGLFTKVGVEPLRWIREVPFVEPASIIGAAPDQKEFKAGDQVGVKLFDGVKRVDVRGISKGRGFQGVIRRYHFNAGPKSRGTKNIREPGSTGMHTDPGRVLKGKRMPGHLGAKPRKARNLKVVRVDSEANLLLVRGAVPGPNGGFVYVEESLRQK